MSPSLDPSGFGTDSLGSISEVIVGLNALQLSLQLKLRFQYF